MKLFMKIIKWLFLIIIGLMIMISYCIIFYRIIAGDISVSDVIDCVAALCGTFVITILYLPLARAEILGEENKWKR